MLRWRGGGDAGRLEQTGKEVLERFLRHRAEWGCFKRGAGAPSSVLASSEISCNLMPCFNPSVLSFRSLALYQILSSPHHLVISPSPFKQPQCTLASPTLRFLQALPILVTWFTNPTHTKIQSARFHITIPLRTCQSLGHAFQTEISDVLRRRKYILNALE
jgi:hypothetical protein